MRVLEPSAGDGRLVEAIWSNATGADNVRVVAVEKAHRLADHLKERRLRQLYANEHNFDIRRADFMDAHDLGEFGAVVMNPPFEKGQDITHVLKAYGLLKPGGRLVAIMCEGPFSRSDKKSTLFREWLDTVGGESERLPADTFKESGTSVQTRLVTITR